MKQHSKRLLAMLMALLMLVGMVPMTASAAEEAPDHEELAIALENQPVTEFSAEEFVGITLDGVGDNEVKESESNNTMKTADTVKNDYTVIGEVSRSDIFDYYKFTLKAPSEVYMVAAAGGSNLMFVLLDSNEDFPNALIDTWYEDGVWMYEMYTILPAGTYYLAFFPDPDYVTTIKYLYYFQTAKVDTYTVKYNANGGEGAPSSQTKIEGLSLTLSTKKPTRDGYTFTGWNTKKDGSGTSYASGGTYTANAAVTLYAQWKVKTYAVKYDANGGTGAPAQQTKTYGKTLTLSDVRPECDGYNFDGWNTKSDGSGTAYSPGASYKSNKAMTLYAQWISDYVTRISGKNRALTALAAADVLKENLGVEKFDSIILASGSNFADALAGSYLAAKKEAPILLYTSGSVEQNLTYITNNLSEDGVVYILGGSGAVPGDIETALTDADVTVKRLSGKDRFATNIEILKEAGVTADQEILVCTGYNFADSLSASATGLPILMVNSKKDTLSEVQLTFLGELTAVEEEPGDGTDVPGDGTDVPGDGTDVPGDGTDVSGDGTDVPGGDGGEQPEAIKLNLTIIGGTGAVSDKLKGELEAYGTVGRLSGKDRYATSAAIAAAYFTEPDTVCIAYGKNFPDGLCGGPLAYTCGAPLLLVQSGKEEAAAEFVAANNITRAYVLGGTGAVSTASVNEIFG